MNKDEIVKLKYILKNISKEKSETILLEVLNHSEFEVNRPPNYISNPDIYYFKIYVSPSIFQKVFDSLSLIERDLWKRIEQTLGINIDKLQVLVDLSKLEVSEIDITPIYTRWEEINELQKRLIDLIDTSNKSIDYQNIGNTSRNIIDKLAREVFDSSKHIPNDSERDFHNGKFKNQLEGFIKIELSGNEYKELRKVAESAIKLVSSTIDIMNLTTHKLNAERKLAELCVVGTLNIINIIKIITEN
jgi:hypothetical protein